MVKVSVIIPTYNRSSLLKIAIDSVLMQSYENYEIIVIDDGSNDTTAKLVNSYVSTKIRYFYQKNRGRSAARNLGIKMAHGEYVAFLDSDDMFLPPKLELQVHELDANPSIGLVYSYAKNIDEKGNCLSYHFEGNLSGWVYPALLFIKNNVITTPTVMVRAKVLAEVGEFDESMDVCEDLDLWRRIARSHQIMQIQQPLSLVRIRTEDKIDVIEFVRNRRLYYEKAISEDLSLLNDMKKLYSELYWTALGLLFSNDCDSFTVTQFIKLFVINKSTGCHNESVDYHERIIELYGEVCSGGNNKL